MFIVEIPSQQLKSVVEGLKKYVCVCVCPVYVCVCVCVCEGGGVLFLSFHSLCSIYRGN